MRFLTPTIFLVTYCVASAAGAQAPASAPAAATQPLKMPSAIMQPALDTLQQTMSMLRPEKWKMSGAAREEAAANISSIRHDLEATLPSLLTSADGAPDSVTQVLPAYRNVEALYDVLLRVSETGSLFAPDQQSSALEEARAKLEVGRRELGERLQSAAVAREKQMHDLQGAVRAIPPPAPASVCPLPPAPTKHKPRKKAAKKPTPAVATPQSTAPATH